MIISREEVVKAKEVTRRNGKIMVKIVCHSCVDIKCNQALSESQVPQLVVTLKSGQVFMSVSRKRQQVLRAREQAEGEEIPEE